MQMNIDRKYMSKEITIMSDSQAAQKSLSAYNLSSKLVWECRRKLDELANKNKVILIWVPGHAGV